MDYLEKNIQYIKGVGEKKAQLFAKLGVSTVGALLSFYPRAYEDWSKTVKAAEAPENEVCCIKAAMASVVQEHRVRKNMVLYKCVFTDGETMIHVTIFNNPYLAKSLNLYEEYLLFGKAEKTLTYAVMSAPRIERIQNGQMIHPIYSATEGLPTRVIEKSVRAALDSLPKGSLEESLPEKLRKAYHLAPIDFALQNVHFPKSIKYLAAARRRLIFEELLTLQLALIKMKSRSKSQSSICVKKDYSKDFYKLLPFTPTNAQKRVIGECIADMGNDTPMNRLVQGDVGSGKTAVAAGVIYSAVKNGYQCALMAPTEILAAQHYQSLQSLLAESGVKVSLLTGSTPAAEKRRIKSALMDGQIDLLIGTHAIIQNDVEFQNLGLVVTDEQHRFGVKQRAALAEKGTDPHLMVMSATPIPRTLAMIIYGDLDISILDEMPKGRQKIDTFAVDTSYHERVYKFIRAALDQGRQAYIVCPLVEEGESELTPAKEYAAQLQNGPFSGYTVGLLHGKMKAKEKEAVMEGFTQGRIQLLVSTTVVEVGVDVPNAVIMLIENAERFGLSQLHQLRGRVGRGSHKSYCILISDSKSEISVQRLAVMRKTNNGFVIADEDLKLRGPGDFFGHRQHGLPDLKIADMLEDMDTLKEAQSCAKQLLSEDYDLALPQHKKLLCQTEALLDKMKN